MPNKLDYVELGLACADVCRALDRGMDGRRLDEFSRSVCEAIEQLTMWVQSIMMHNVRNSLTMFLAAELLQKSSGRSSTELDGIYLTDSSTREVTRRQLRPGGWTSTGSFTSLMCVPLILSGHC